MRKTFWMPNDELMSAINTTSEMLRKCQTGSCAQEKLHEHLCKLLQVQLTRASMIDGDS